MPDFGPRWTVVEKRPLGKGGQGKAFLVSDGENPSTPNCVAKVLDGAELTVQSPRWKRLEQEIETSKSFSHANVVRVIDSGYTKGSGYPFFVMPFYSGGSLQGGRAGFPKPGAIFKLFLEICDGVAYIHSNNVVHRDLKPANIFLRDAHAIVGDLGLCFRFDAESLTETTEVAAARWFGAPELRDGHLDHPLPSADIYSLGKLLYWLFTGRVFDRDEQAYDTEDKKLSRILGQPRVDVATEVVDDRLIHAGAFADDIVSQTVRYKPDDRIQSASVLSSKVRQLIARFECGGHALDLRLPQRCLFCGNGNYKPAAAPPSLEQRTAAPDPRVLPMHRPPIWEHMRSQTSNSIGQAFGGRGGDLPVPLNLICDYCGNMQHFRWDWASEAQKHWQP